MGVENSCNCTNSTAMETAWERVIGSEITWQREAPAAQQLWGCLEWGRASHFLDLEGVQEASTSKEDLGWAEGHDVGGPGSRLCGSANGQPG